MKDSADILNCLSKIEKELTDIDYTTKILINELSTLQQRQNSLSNTFKILKEIHASSLNSVLVNEEDMARELVKSEKKVIQLKNGQVNIPFEDKLDLSEFGIQNKTNIQFGGIEDIEWNLDKSLFTGTPKNPGEYIGYFRYLDSNTSEQLEKEVHFLVNPDPRSLWKEIEPPKDEPYQKVNSDFSIIHRENRKVISASLRGKSHAHKGSFREDDFESLTFENGWLLQVVADGAGSAKYSRKGSELACKAVLENVNKVFSSGIEKELDQLILDNSQKKGKNLILEQAELIKSLIINTAKHAHDNLQKFVKEEKTKISHFASTLLFALSKDFDFGTVIISFSVGDGAIASICGNVGELLMNPDGGEYSGQTCFLSEPRLFDEANYNSLLNRMAVNIYHQKVDSVILMTDGVSDPKFGTEFNLKESKRWIEFYNELKPILLGKSVKEQLLGWLDFYIPGEYDDRTISILV